jgi:glycosyltransferase involved in cell wall biosynthesis
MVMHIWLVNPFDPLPHEYESRPMRYQMLATELLRRGHRVTWLSSNFAHARKAYRQPVTPTRSPSGLLVQLLPTPRYRRNIGPGRLRNHAHYCAQLRHWMQTNPPPDGIVVSYPLPEAALDCLRYGRQQGVPVVVDVQDMWPDTFLEILPPWLHWAGRSFLSRMYRQSHQVFQQAAHCVAVSEHYQAFAAARRGQRPIRLERVHYLGYESADSAGDEAQALQTLQARNFTPATINFSFVGTLGVTYDIACVIEAAQRLQHTAPQVRFVIAGDGPQRLAWQAEAARRGLGNLVFLGFLNTIQLRALLRHSFAGLVTIRHNRHSIPNKPAEYMAFGLPLVNSLEGEFARLVNNEPLGVSYVAEDASSLTQAIQRLLGDPAFTERCRQRVGQAFATRFSARAIYPAYADDLEQICMPAGQLLECA